MKYIHPRFTPTQGLALSLCLTLVACTPPSITSPTGQPNQSQVLPSSQPATIPTLKKRSLAELQAEQAKASQITADPAPAPTGLLASEKGLYAFGLQLPPAERAQINTALDQEVKALEAKGVFEIKGRISPGQGEKLNNWVILAFAPGGRELSRSLSNEQGEFALKDIPQGLRLELMAYQPQRDMALRAFYDTLPDPRPALELTPESTVLANILRHALQQGDTNVHQLPLQSLKELTAQATPALLQAQAELVQKQSQKMAEIGSESFLSPPNTHFFGILQALTPNTAQLSQPIISGIKNPGKSIFEQINLAEINKKQKEIENISLKLTLKGYIDDISQNPAVKTITDGISQGITSVNTTSLIQSSVNAQKTTLSNLNNNPVINITMSNSLGSLQQNMNQITSALNQSQINQSQTIQTLEIINTISLKQTAADLRILSITPPSSAIGPSVISSPIISNTGFSYDPKSIKTSISDLSIKQVSANENIPLLTEGATITQILKATFLQTEFQARLLWGKKANPGYSGAEIYLRSGNETRVITLNLASLKPAMDSQPVQNGPLTLSLLGDQALELTLNDLTPLSDYEVFVRDVYDAQFSQLSADGVSVSNFTGALPKGVFQIKEAAPTLIGEAKTTGLRPPQNGFVLPGPEEDTLVLPGSDSDLQAWLRDQEIEAQAKAAPYAETFQLPSRKWRLEDIGGYRIFHNGAIAGEIRRADFGKHTVPNANGYLKYTFKSNPGKLTDLAFEVLYRDTPQALSFREFFHLSPETAAAEPLNLEVKATPVQGQEYSQILLEFKGLPDVSQYRVYADNRLLGTAQGQEGQMLAFKAEGLTPGTRYEFKVEALRNSDPVTGKTVATTWQPASSSGSGGNSTVPGLMALTPNAGIISSAVTITGQIFDSTPANNTVKFGTTQATVTAASATSLTVTVPPGIFGNKDVSVTVAGQSSTSTLNFAVTPSIASFAPVSAPITGSFTINGTGFDTTPGNNTVSLGGTPVTVTGATNTALTVTMPSKNAGAYATTVQVGTQTSASSNMTTLSTITTFAGNGTANFGGDNGAPTSAQLNQPWSVSVNSANHVVISDTANHRLRFVPGSTLNIFGRNLDANTIYTLTGDGTPNFSGDTGVATSGQVSSPRSIQISNGNNISFADSGNQRIRVIPNSAGSLFNLTVAVGNIYTAGGFGAAGAATDGVARFAAGATFQSPEGMTLDANGSIFADTGNNVIRLVNYLAAGTLFGRTVTSNNIYHIAGGGFGGQTLNAPSGVFNTSTRDLYVADTGNHRILFAPNVGGTYFGQTMTANNLFVIAGTTGTTGTTGDGGAATSAFLNSPKAVFANANGVFIADTGNHRVRFIPLANGSYYGQTMLANNIYTLAGTGTGGFNNDSIAANAGQLNDPTGISVDAVGNVYIADRLNHRIRRVSP